MDKLKTKGSLTIVAAVCVVLSLFAGFGFLPAASGFSCLWHTMFPQLRDTDPTNWAIAGPPMDPRPKQ